MSGYDHSQVQLPDPESEQEPEGRSFADRQQLKIHEILACGSGWTPAEQWVVKWQFRLLGDFGMALAAAIARADDENLERLRLGFPVEVTGLLAWRNDPRSHLVQRLRAAGLEI